MPSKVSPKQYVADLHVLSNHNAAPIFDDNENKSESGRHGAVGGYDKATSASNNTSTCNNEEPIICGITISNWHIRTSSSTIANEGEMDALTLNIQELANSHNAKNTQKSVEDENLEQVGGGKHYDDDNDDGKKGIVMLQTSRKRRLCAPEIVFLNALVHLKLQTKRHDGEDEEEDDDHTLVNILFSASDALGEWAACHSFLSHENYTQGQGDAFQGVSVIKSIDAKLWSERRRQQQQAQHRSQSQSNRSTDCFGQNAISTSTEFNYDWTFSTPYTGTIVSRNMQQTMEAIQWKPSFSSLIDLSLLTDQKQPILYFDDINLYEDDMHDNGFSNLKCKIRVMPTCFFCLMTLFVRVDHVLIRIKEVRIFCKFPLVEEKCNDDEVKKHRICKDVTWRECKWDQLNELNLPSFVGSWRIEDENGGQATQNRIQGLLRKLPLIDLPKGGLLVASLTKHYDKQRQKQKQVEQHPKQSYFIVKGSSNNTSQEARFVASRWSYDTERDVEMTTPLLTTSR